MNFAQSREISHFWIVYWLNAQRTPAYSRKPCFSIPLESAIEKLQILFSPWSKYPFLNFYLFYSEIIKVTQAILMFSFAWRYCYVFPNVRPRLFLKRLVKNYKNVCRFNSTIFGDFIYCWIRFSSPWAKSYRRGGSKLVS